MEEPKVKKPTAGIHDEDLDLGHILHTADAPHLGAHPQVSSLLRPKAKLIGRSEGTHLKSLVGGGGSSALDANQSGGLNPNAVSGETSTPSPKAVDQEVDVMQTNSAGVESDSANSRRQ